MEKRRPTLAVATAWPNVALFLVSGSFLSRRIRRDGGPHYTDGDS